MRYRMYRNTTHLLKVGPDTFTAVLVVFSNSQHRVALANDIQLAATEYQGSGGLPGAKLFPSRGSISQIRRIHYHEAQPLSKMVKINAAGFADLDTRRPT